MTIIIIHVHRRTNSTHVACAAGLLDMAATSFSEQVLEKLSVRLSVPLNLLQEVARNDELVSVLCSITLLIT